MFGVRWKEFLLLEGYVIVQLEHEDCFGLNKCGTSRLWFQRPQSLIEPLSSAFLSWVSEVWLVEFLAISVG